jgi:hypothetical protein
MFSFEFWFSHICVLFASLYSSLFILSLRLLLISHFPLNSAINLPFQRILLENSNLLRPPLHQHIPILTFDVDLHAHYCLTIN